MKKLSSSLCATVCLMAACQPPTEADAYGEVEVTEQGFLSTFTPYGSAAVTAVYGRLPGVAHRIVYQRRSDGHCTWFDVGPENMAGHPVMIGLGPGDDTGNVVAPGTTSTIICNGVVYRFNAPVLDPLFSTQMHSASINGFEGNDWLTCNQKGICNGHGGNDTLITWHSYAPPNHVQLNGDTGNDKIISYDATAAVAMNGNAGSDCLAHQWPANASKFKCSDTTSPPDAEWDRSSIWLGEWCNEVDPNFCANWPF